MSAPVRILVVDDEPPIRKLLRAAFGSQGYDVIEAATGAEARRRLAEKPAPDLVILDLGLPDVQGHELLREWREAGDSTPVIVLSSRTDEAGIVAALELGADDYVTKPFSAAELLARIKVALRHRLQAQGERPVFLLGDLSVDLVNRIIRLKGEEVKLTPREYDILRVMIQYAGRALTHSFLIRQVWGSEIDVQNLRVHIRQLRQKIEADPDRPRFVLTETGIGYRLKAPEP
jgi:two-component system KDP operon response regulator KdpE